MNLPLTWEEVFLRLNESKESRHAMMAEILAASIAHQIRETRIKRGLTQRQLAGRTGTKQSVIARYERGDYINYQIDTLQKIAAALDCALIIRFDNWSIFISSLGVEFIAPESFDAEELIALADNRAKTGIQP